MVPGTSNSRVSFSGLPHWSDSARAKSSARSASTAAKRCRASDRSPGVVAAQPGKASRAAATAASTSSGPASSYVYTSAPVAGSTTAWVRPEVPFVRRPAMNCAPSAKRSCAGNRSGVLLPGLCMSLSSAVAPQLVRRVA